MESCERRPLAQSRSADQDVSSEAVFRLLAGSNLSVGFALLNARGDFVAWNPGAVRIEGYAEEEVLGQPFSTIFTETERRQGEPQRRLQIARVNGPFEEEGWRTRRDGSRFWAMVTMTTLQVSGRRADGLSADHAGPVGTASRDYDAADLVCPAELDDERDVGRCTAAELRLEDSLRQQTGRRS